MTQFTDEQKKYITYKKQNDSKLLACAGSGKTRCIISRIEYLIKKNIYKNNEILMLTFSRFTKDDFLNKINNYKVDCIDKQNVKTIDSFAKTIIDPDNEIDISLLSYKFMKYLEDIDPNELKKNIKIASIKTLFIDESQDLNEIQFNIIKYMKEKNNTVINLIGDPNQNIYQFRKSSDKYLTSFSAKTFHLTKNFRSHDGIINFSKFLRPDTSSKIDGHLGNNDSTPTIIFHEHDSELETHIMTLLDDAKQSNINLSDIAILAPTRGRMRGYGKSHGLCFVSNLLYKNNIKFKQFYEETTEDFSFNIKYIPKKDHVNVLTYMGSKGLEWKYVILIDTDMCLINKRFFDVDKHKNDQYLLYVACSRAIENVVIFSKYSLNEGNLNFQLNPWFSIVPSSNYTLDERFVKHFKYPKIKPRDMGCNEKRVTKILNNFDEKTLDEVSKLCKFGCNVDEVNSKSTKIVTNIYKKDFSTSIESNAFLGKYIESLFLVYYSMKNKTSRKRYVDIENIIDSKHIITDIPLCVSEWFYNNRDFTTWNKFDSEKSTLDKVIVNTIEKKFSRDIELHQHTIVNDGYFKNFILSMSETIKINYDNYRDTTNTTKIRKYLFFLIVITYSLETQHYYHVTSKGKKFKNLLTSCSDLFDEIQSYAYKTDIDFCDNNIPVSKFGLIGEIDLIENKDDKKIIWEIKCVSDISLKHIVQVLMYNIMYNDIYSNKNDHDIHLNFINFLKGEMTNVSISLTSDEIDKLKNIFISGSQQESQL
jgi:hypothetical protein